MLTGAFDDADEMRDFRDHPAHGRRIFEGLAAADLIETEADQCAALVVSNVR